MNDFVSIIQWYTAMFLLGIIFFPFSSIVFKQFVDRGYVFSKILAMLIVSYSVYVFGSIKLLSFSYQNLFLLLAIAIIVNGYILITHLPFKGIRKSLNLIIFEEILFFVTLCIWSWIRSHEPSINGLEKFMDYGFVNSILRTEYFPALDIWFAPFSINYYYFGHLVTAVLTKLSFLPSNVSYNLMIATIFAFAFASSFSIVYTFASHAKVSTLKQWVSGILGGLLVACSGNLHVLYAFFEAYTPSESPVPLWTLMFRPMDILSNGYWYPNATRFIPNTIHEFPLYSFVVSDLHGHVLDIPVVLVMIAVIYTIVQRKFLSIGHSLLFGFLLSVMYMTNVLDFGIYFLLLLITIIFVTTQYIKKDKNTQKHSESNQTQKARLPLLFSIKHIGITLLSTFVFSLPFSLHFKPFVSGIGIICGYEFVDIILKPVLHPIVSLTGGTWITPEKIGPFLLEPNHCARSEWWMLLTLYGFFYFFVVILFVFLLKNRAIRKNPPFAMVTILSVFATILIFIPEFAYVKDIYPDHYRANTMFKLTYQSFIMLSLVSAFVAGSILHKKHKILLVLSILLISCVLLYTRFAIFSYYGDLANYKGLDGTQYLQDKAPDDLAAINWINSNISGQPVIAESQGDSYTDHARISANTGVITILGWTVHEWLWRGTYDIPAPRITDVTALYESKSLEETRALLKKYNVSYVYIGNLEREKYPAIQENKFNTLGTVLYKNNSVKIYKITR